MKYRIVYIDTVASTNDHARALAREGIAEGTVIVSDFQTRGRGRFHRQWVSPRGKNILCSLVLRPPVRVNESPLLTYVAARSVKEAIAKMQNVSCHLKKPNDVLINKKKVSGILTESHSKANMIEYMVLGIGINVNAKKKELVRGATSLVEETGQEISRDELLETLLKIFSHHYVSYKKDNKR